MTMSPAPLWTCTLVLFLGLVSPAVAGTRSPDASAALSLVWPPPPDSVRVRYLGELRGPKDLGRSGSWLTRAAQGLAGARSHEAAVLARPTDVYAEESTHVFVTDASTGKLHLFDYSTKTVRAIGSSGLGTLTKPLGLGGDGQGHVMVTDPPSGRVVVFTLDGRYVRAMGGPGVLLNPIDVAADPRSGEAWVVDSYLHQVVVFDSTGRVVRRIGKQKGSAPNHQALSQEPEPISGHGAPEPATKIHVAGKRASDVVENRGTATGEFLYPISITRSPDGRYHVTDGLNGRVQTFDAGGRFVSSFGQTGDTPGSLPRPKGIASDTDGNLHVVDAAFNNVQVFSNSGQLLLSVGSLGQELGRFWLPLGIHIDRTNRIYVADRYNGRVQIFQYLSASPAAPGGQSPGRDHRVASQKGERP